MKQPIIIFILLQFLCACAPTNHVYVKNFTAKVPEVKQVMIMVEYLDVRDDIKGLWNFEEVSNLQNQDYLYELASDMLISKGYEIAEMSLKTSGLIINREFYVDHFTEKQAQQLAIGPPYILRSINLDNSTIQGLEMLLSELNSPMSQVMSTMRSYVKNNYRNETNRLGMLDETAILIIQAYKPRVSIFANMQVGLMTSSSGNAAFVDMNNRIRPTTYAYMVHKGTGDLLWSNKTTLITQKNQQKFFFELPIKHKQ